MMPAVVPEEVAANCVAAACGVVAWQGDTWGTSCFLFLPNRVAADAAACGTSFGLSIPAVIDHGWSFLVIRASVSGAPGTLTSRTRTWQGRFRVAPVRALLQFTKTAAPTLAGGRWMDPWPKASCRMLDSIELAGWARTRREKREDQQQPDGPGGGPGGAQGPVLGVRSSSQAALPVPQRLTRAELGCLRRLRQLKQGGCTPKTFR
ncbi:hypothetical protein NDU88_001801 [Pleurodeles waltl]|uniref:Uncharacterized protein n=1 Tax=Pleurodeles waltl TaxID=8319 RepID=A0AAV7T072_PLEWA|nr:hypothetical protein NDU88_001801 [Pleurodeles waltl]